MWCRGLLPVLVPCSAGGGVAPMGPWPGCGRSVARGSLQVLAGAWVVSGPPALWGEGWGSGPGLSPCRRSRWICRPPGPAEGAPVGGPPAAGPCPSPGGADLRRGQCWEPAGTIVPTGNAAVRAQRSLAPSPAPPAEVAPRPGQPRQESGWAGQWTRPLVARAGPVLSHVGEAPGSTVPLPAGLGAKERGGGGGGTPGEFGEGAHAPAPWQPLPEGRAHFGGARRGLGVGTARGDPSLS